MSKPKKRKKPSLAEIRDRAQAAAAAKEKRTKKISPELIEKIRVRVADGRSLGSVARELDIGRSTVSRYTLDLYRGAMPGLDGQAEILASRFYALFEAEAGKRGLDTTGIPWENLPEKRRDLLIDVCKGVLMFEGDEDE